jgi:uncharacterized damage-inducible protein DinB
MYHTLSEFLLDWSLESKVTLKLLENLTDESLNLKLNNKVRTPGRLAWHIALTVNEMSARTGLSIKALDEDVPVPSSAKEICEAYKDSSQSLAEAIASQWDDESLKEEIQMYGEKWTKEKVLSSLIRHQIHHRGQLSVLMRMAGLKVIGVYGPSYEEWQQFNMQPQD